MKKIIIALSLIGIALLNNSCQKVSGCTDPTAVNYNSNASVDNGTCKYNANAIFYNDVPVSGPVTVTISGLSPSTQTFNTYVTGAAPVCGTGGLGNFSTQLPISTPSAVYNYTTTMSGLNMPNWSGSVTFSQSNCSQVLLPAAPVSFYTTDYGNASALPITIAVAGFTAQITSISSTTPGGCNGTGNANFIGLPLGTYTYTATAAAGSGISWTPGTITLSADGTCYLQPIP